MCTRVWSTLFMGVRGGNKSWANQQMDQPHEGPYRVTMQDGQDTRWHRHQETGSQTEDRPKGQQITALGWSVLGPDTESRLVAARNPTDSRAGSSQPWGVLRAIKLLKQLWLKLHFSANAWRQLLFILLLYIDEEDNVYHTWSHRTLRESVFSSSIWVPGIKHRSSGLVTWWQVSSSHSLVRSDLHMGTPCLYTYTLNKCNFDHFLRREEALGRWFNS